MLQSLRGSILLTSVALTLAVSPFASGAERAPFEQGQTYITGGSYLFGRDDDADLDSFFAAGLGIGGRLTDEWAIELNYTRGFSESNQFDTNYDVEVETYRLDALYDFGGDNIKPYAVAGLGMLAYDPRADFANRSTSPLFNIGAGVALPATSRLSSRADARMYYVEDSQELLPVLSLGISYIFSGPTSPYPPRDSDGDGVYDRDDQCASTPPGVDVDARGCALDGDGDGVPDASDACPRTPAGVDVDGRGCARDRDGDGVPDHLDACRGTPRGDEVDARGCTIMEEEEMVSASIELNLEFDFDSSDLRPGHSREIDRVAEFMEANPNTSAQLEGHTDSRGTEAYNQALSERRAYSVRDYLIDEADIDPRRITAVGYGESRPGASNDTAAGRQLNRRVNAVIETREMSVRPRRRN